MSDIKDAGRALRATPIVGAVAIASLALGIGATTAIFSILNSLLLRSLPVKDPRAGFRRGAHRVSIRRRSCANRERIWWCRIRGARFWDSGFATYN
jgi:hypothetical protein